MKIIHITTTESGGAGTAVIRLHETLVNLNYTSHILVFNKTSSNEFITDITKGNPFLLLVKIARKLKHEYNKKFNKKIVSKYNFFNYSENSNYINHNSLFKKLPYVPEIIIIHFISHFVNFKNIYELAKSTNARVIFNMLDMASLTGGCHFAWDCLGYTRLCGHCPAIKSNKEYDESRKSLLFKQKFINKINPVLVATSEETYIQAKKSTLFKDLIIYKSLLPINSNDFAPSKKSYARDYFSLPIDKKIIFAGSQNLEDERKGFKNFICSLDLLYTKLSEKQREDLIILTAGEKPIENYIKFRNIHLGTLKSKEALIRAYQSADIFVCPSIEDSSPMMLNEAVSCGIPVVAFDMGVAKDLISFPNTGYKAELNNNYDFANGLYQILFTKDTNLLIDKMSENCRINALKLTSSISVGQQWDEIIKNLTV
jgi:glycosyltransferase involved in cell wall biosynthesis